MVVAVVVVAVVVVVIVVVAVVMRGEVSLNSPSPPRVFLIGQLKNTQLFSEFPRVFSLARKEKKEKHPPRTKI